MASCAIFYGRTQLARRRKWRTIPSPHSRWNTPIPEWLVERWLDEFGQRESAALMLANNQKRAPVVLRANSAQIQSGRIAGKVAGGRNCRVSDTVVAARNLARIQRCAWKICRASLEGLFQVQGGVVAAGCLFARALPGERILDACAAPGGKATHIAELMNDSGELIAIDNSARGIEKICENIARLGSYVRFKSSKPMRPMS